MARSGAKWAALAGAAALAAGAGAAQLAALARVQPGQWQLKEIGAAGERRVCVADPAAVLQIGHGEARCARTVLDSDPKTLVVHYTCPGAGHGRTTLTYRTPTSFRLQTQGLAGGAPFDFDYDAKRIGDCPGTAAAAATPAGSR